MAGAKTRVTELRNGTRAEAARLIKSIVPATPEDAIKVRIALTAQGLNWTAARVEEIWRGRARRIEAFEMDILRRYARQK